MTTNRAARRAAGKLPPRRVPCDSFTLTVGGESYTPRAGEWVEYGGGVNVALFLAAAAIEDLRADDSPETRRGFREAIEELVDGLAALIVAWNWTDDAGEPLPNPPGVAGIKALTLEELLYLMGAATRSPTGEPEKNGSSPLIPISTESRARGRRRVG